MKLKDIGDHQHVVLARNYMDSFLRGDRVKNALLLHGPPGCGKTTLARALAEEYGLEIIDVNASDTRDASTFEALKDAASNQGVLVFVDEADSLRGDSIRGLVQSNTAPVVVACNNATYVSKATRFFCLPVHVPVPERYAIRKAGKDLGCSPERIAKAKTFRDLVIGEGVVEEVEGDLSPEARILMGSKTERVKDYMNLDAWILDNTEGLEALAYDEARGRCLTSRLTSMVVLILSVKKVNHSVTFPDSLRVS